MEEDPSAPDGFRVRHGKDYFILIDNRWFGADLGGFWDYVLTRRGPKAIVCGRTVRDEQYWSVIKRAKVEGLG